MGKPDRTLFRRGVESKDVTVMMEAFADGAVLHSPITFKPFEGRRPSRASSASSCRCSRTSATRTS